MGTLHPLQNTFPRYRQLVDQFAVTDPAHWEPEEVLALLRLRDQIQSQIEHSDADSDHSDLPKNFWLDLANTDAQLGRLSTTLREVEALTSWQKTFHPPDHHWWWYPSAPPSPPAPLTWLWGGLTVAALTLNLALAQDMASRFLTGAPGVWSSVGAIAPVVLALFASGGALTKVGQQLLESALAQQGAPKQNLAGIKFLLAVALLAGLFSMHSLGLPRFAQHYNARGEMLYKAGNWASAQNHFQRALGLQPDFPQAQFNQGVIFEEFQEYGQAQSEYLKSVQGGYLPAYNNLSRLYLRSGDDNQAIPLILNALSDPDLKQEDPELEYVLRKNLGQVRLKQGRLSEAETELLEAIAIGTALAEPRPDAYCILAQVLDQQPTAPTAGAGDAPPTALPTAQEAWTQCLQYASRPEDDPWLGMARKALTSTETPNHAAPSP